MQAGYSVGNLNDLRAVPPNRRTNAAVRFVFQKREFYVFNADSTAADDNDRIIAPDTGLGRWEAVRPVASPGGGDGGGSGDLSQIQEQIDRLNGEVLNPYGYEDSQTLYDRVGTVEYEVFGGPEGPAGLSDRIDQVASELESLDLQQLQTNITNQVIVQVRDRCDQVFTRTQKYVEQSFTGSGSKTLFVPGFANFNGASADGERLHVSIQATNNQPSSHTITYVPTAQVPVSDRVANVVLYARIDFTHTTDFVMTVFVYRHFANSFRLFQSIF